MLLAYPIFLGFRKINIFIGYRKISCHFYRADNNAQPRQIGGNNEICELFPAAHLQGAYIRATALQRQTGNRYIIFQRNSAAVISALTNAFTLANLVQVINQCLLPGTTVVLKDYGMYGGKGAVQQQFQQQFPNTAVCTYMGSTTS